MDSLVYTYIVVLVPTSLYAQTKKFDKFFNEQKLKCFASNSPKHTIDMPPSIIFAEHRLS